MLTTKTFTLDEWQNVLLIEHGSINEASFNLWRDNRWRKTTKISPIIFGRRMFCDPLAAGADLTMEVLSIASLGCGQWSTVRISEQKPRRRSAQISASGDSAACR